ncbi:MAG: hypothetical protein EBU88_08280 [Acidobacteria bacterium]|nr:hypothetical protein [Acidobacteriota bacterium]
MNFVTVWTYSQTAYYETRLLLLLVGLTISLYFLFKKQESRYLVIFISSSLLMAVTEYLFQLDGLRGEGYTISVFGQTVPPIYRPLCQGLLDGGFQGLMALWFADLRLSRASGRAWSGWVGFSILICGLACLSGRLAVGQLPRSVQPIFSMTPIVLVTAMIFLSLAVAWHRDAITMIANYFAGLLVITLINNGPLHVFGARYVGVIAETATVVAELPWQIGIGVLSGIFESAGGKLHYLTIPLMLGLVAVRVRSTSAPPRLSYQQLQNLANRGWRRRSKPFRRNSE